MLEKIHFARGGGLLFCLWSLASLACEEENNRRAFQSGSAGGAGRAGSDNNNTPPGGAGGLVEPGTCFTEQDCASFKTALNSLPPRPEGDLPEEETPSYHAVSQWFLGDTERDGTDNGEAWKEYGFDIDGWSSTPKQGFHCQPYKGATPLSIREDGKGGIDNAFGKVIVNEILLPVLSSPSVGFSKSLLFGGQTLLFAVRGHGDFKSNVLAPSQVFHVVGQGAPGEDWTSYEWRPLQDLLDNDDSSFFQMKDSYVSAGTWVSSPEITLPVTLAVGDIPLKLVIHKARISTVPGDSKGVLRGTVGGILSAEDLSRALSDFGSRLLPKYVCPVGGSTSLIDGILEQVRQACDILMDGTQDPSKTCDGVSIGLGFNARLSSLGAPLPPLPALPDPCQ